ncbi:DUF3164 family protein [Serratia symbiotica]|uniref:DUF3164 family protein n=2 Tax=Serratia symbiotica TaxID=138074 RepID=A0A068Z7A2_9GAMM|nr:DUF3164 family protein [Serratia symbiotica]MBQ0955111.1 DUF3164 family protein [Serratia symbiotica]MBQ0955373.1 DUF3164 family protein [Serratia symbiotica]MBQ0956076.1 DUF3164 family protein [Serratia symbiotica]QLH62002.1 DUF3164 family protein [Serratia symbiotica]QTP14190.1 DUF3164 family protein [Serratia symbiotica]
MSTNTTENTIPAGYWKDARGILTPESLIKPVDKERDALVKAIVERAKPLQQALRDFKQDTFADIQALVDLSAEQYGATIGGKKGNVTLYNYDGQFKVQRAMQDRIAFDERIQAAKELIDACVAEWTQGARPELLAIIDRAFSTDKEGEINPGRVLQLRRHDITDPRWLRAMDALAEAVQVVSSKSYIRLYERVGDTDQYVPISLDIAGV